MGRSKRGHERRLEECWSWRQLSAQRHLRHPNVYTPFRIPVTPNHQYLPKLLLFSSRDQVREDRVVRELRPCSELMTMPRKVESEVEFAPVLGVGRSPQVMYWETTRVRMPRGLRFDSTKCTASSLDGVELHWYCASWEEPFGGSPGRSFGKTNGEPERKRSEETAGKRWGP